MDHSENSELMTENNTTQNETVNTEQATEPATENGCQWYSVSYQNQKGTYFPSVPSPVRKTPAKHRSRGWKSALIAAFLACSMLLCGISGFGGALLANHLLPSFFGSPSIDTESGNGTPNKGTVYGNSGDEDYAYEDVTLAKNDGSTLQNSIKGSAGENAGTVMSATAAVKDSVVEIMTTATTNHGTIFAGAGSGVIIHADGVIVTNHHVIDGASTIRVRLTNGNTYEAVLRGSDEEGDIAVIKIRPEEALTVAKLGYSGALALGEEVIAIGNPLGELGGTVTHGIISALQREINVDGVGMTLIQTNAAINSGNSGGGLFNLAGELIGIVNAKYAAEGVEGLGFAIPIDTASISINHLLALGYIPGVPDLGVTLINKDAYLNSVRVRMPYVSEATDGSALRQGDFIHSIDGTSVVVNYYYGSETPLDVVKRSIRARRVGDTVTLGIYRDGVSQTVEVTLVEYVPSKDSVDFE